MRRAAPNCKRKSSRSDLAFFRCQKWVENCRRAGLEDKTPDQLNKHYRLCAKQHFEISVRPSRTVFQDNAIPTMFDLTSHLNNPHSRHRKRIKELKKKDETSEQEQKHKETNNSNQNISLDGHEADEIPEGLFIPDNFQALLECRIKSGEEVLRKRSETTAVNTLFCSKTQQRQMLEICESCIREETQGSERPTLLFHVTDDVVDIPMEENLLLVRFVDESHNLREEIVGFLPCEADAESLALKFHTTITEKWGLNMEYYRGQAYVVSSGFPSKMKVVKHPRAIYTRCSSCALSMWLAKLVPVMGESVALGTTEEVCSFFHRSPQLLLEFDNVISALFQNSKERGKELKEICYSQWTSRHDAFEMLVELLQALVLCLDGINSDTYIRWNNCTAGRTFVLCSGVTDFDFIVTVVVLKNVLSFTRAFGENVQGQISHVFFAAGSLTAVLHSLNKVMENTEEATNIATKLDVQMKLPRKFPRACQGNLAGISYKEILSIPTVEHNIQELKDTFSEQHLKTLKCLSLVPSVMGQLKFNTSEEHYAEMYRSDLPNPDTLSAELHCWSIKWKHKGKDTEFLTTIYEALHLPDSKFFPNVYIAEGPEHFDRPKVDKSDLPTDNSETMEYS
uniref:THAP-type domain-containing protein n=1 Tax=Aotus nancymaae TaxID=37293 RepID=A0A2K5DXQ6_AOTNA